MNINKVLAINLKYEVKRRKHITEVMAKITDNSEIIEAIATPNVQFPHNPKLLGHGISHCIALSKVDKETLILEDDAIIDYEGLKLLEPPSDWKIIALCCSIKNKPLRIKDNVYKTPKDTVVTAAYIIRDATVASSIINFWLINIQNPFPRCIFDYSIYEGITEGNYCVYPMIAQVLSGETTIWKGFRDNTNIMETTWKKLR